jgi:5-methylcytosine-specific restriction endonuclease McrA
MTSRRPEWIPKRRAIPKPAQREVFARSRMICEDETGCTRPGKHIDHIKPVSMGGTNAPDNLRLLCVEHHAPKSADETRAAVKSDKQGGRLGQYSKRQRAKASGKHRPIQNGGFQSNRDSRFKKKLDGSVVERGRS